MLDTEAQSMTKAFAPYGVALESRLLLGTAQYPSPQILADAIRAAEVDVVTVSLRREAARGTSGERFWAMIKELGVRVLPNTAGCRTPKEAITTAQMARELFGTDWIKLEVIANDDTLQPDLFGLVEYLYITLLVWIGVAGPGPLSIDAGLVRLFGERGAAAPERRTSSTLGRYERAARA